MAKPTPGPWKVEELTPTRVFIVAEDGTLIAELAVECEDGDGMPSPDERQANARLFAMAPRLLKLAESVAALQDDENEQVHEARAIVAEMEKESG
jgi:hypothetical protein